jgi:hypothetical protein
MYGFVTIFWSPLFFSLLESRAAPITAPMMLASYTASQQFPGMRGYFLEPACSGPDSVAHKAIYKFYLRVRAAARSTVYGGDNGNKKEIRTRKSKKARTKLNFHDAGGGWLAGRALRHTMPPRAHAPFIHCRVLDGPGCACSLERGRRRRAPCLGEYWIFPYFLCVCRCRCSPVHSFLVLVRMLLVLAPDSLRLTELR